MKIKFSKKILSVVLAVLMVVTSVPVIGFAAFAEDNSIDPAVAEVQAAMDNFYQKLAAQGSFTNVGPAYDAFVDCQKALDAYIYGGEDDALNGKAEALTNAMNNIQSFTGYTGTAVPTFNDSPASGDGSMAPYAGIGYNNVLYAPLATQLTRSAAKGNAYHSIHYGANSVLLYDGVNDTILPVMVSGLMEASANGYSKTRYIYSSYPSDASGNDDANWSLVGAWRSGNGGTADWDWSWYTNSSSAGYNKATGFLGNATTSVRSGRIPACNRWFDWGYKYSESSPLYMANALRLNTEPSGVGQEYTLTWYTMTGDSPNSANDISTETASAPIRVINYKALTDAIVTNGTKMKAVDLLQFSEGGLMEYIDAMDLATTLNPNDYFTSGDGYTTCVNAITTAINTMNAAPTDKTDSTEYAQLRTAMEDQVRNTYAAGNLGYTADSWLNFTNAYENAMSVMAAVNDSTGGYLSASIASSAAQTLTTAYTSLQTEATKVDSSSLEAAIKTFEGYPKASFTTESYSAVLEVVNAAKTAVWGSVGDYGMNTSLPEDSPEAQELVAAQTQAVLDATKLLRISSSAIVAVIDGHRYSLAEAIALRDTIQNTTDYTNFYEFDSAVTAGKAYESTLAQKEFTDFEAQIAEYTTYVNNIVTAYYNLQYSFTLLPDGTVASETIGSTSGYSADNNRTYLSNAITNITYIKTASGNSSYTTDYALTHDNAWQSWGQDRGVQMHSLGFGAFGQDTMTTSNGSMKVTWKEGGALLENTSGAYSTYHSYLMKTPEQAVDGSDYVNIPGGTTVNKIFGETTVTVGDLGIASASFTTPDIYTYFICDGETRNFVNTDVKQTVTVVDISDLFELVASANELMARYDYNNYKCYTEASWSTLVTALQTAQNNMDYTNMTAQEIVSEAQWRYNNLNRAMSGLIKNTTDPIHKLEELPDSVHATCTTAGTIHSQCTLCGTEVTTTEEALGHDYVYTSKGDGNTHTVTCTRADVCGMEPYIEDCTNNGENVCSDCGQVLLASWTEYTVAINALKSALIANLYPVSTLNGIKSQLESMTYYQNYITSNTDSIYSDEQDAINAEAAQIEALIPTQTPIDVSVLEAAKLEVKDPDQYDANAIALLEAEMYSTVNIANTDIKGTVKDSQPEIDALITEAVSAVMTYDIYVNDVVVKYDVPYGTEITVDGEGQVIEGDTVASNSVYVWSGYFGAPSYGTDESGDYKKSSEKYLVNGSTYTFIVKGDSYLSAISADGSDADDSYLVTVKTSVPIYTNRISTIDYVYTENDGTVNLPEAPAYANYKFVGYTDADGEPITSDTVFTDNSVVIAQYELVTQKYYEIISYDALGSYFQDAMVYYNTDLYNALIDYGYLFSSVSEQDFYCWASVSKVNVDGTDYHYFEVVSYDYDYSFYVCEDVKLVPLTVSDVQTFFDTPNGAFFPSQMDYDLCILRCNGEVVDPSVKPINVGVVNEVFDVNDADGNYAKSAIIGKLAIPDGYTLLEKGFLVNLDDAASLTADDFVVTNDNIIRKKVLHLTRANQFVLNMVGLSKGTQVDYCAYAILEDSEGNRIEIYSDPIMDAVL